MCQKHATTTNILLELDDPDKPPESNFAYLDKNGKAYFMASKLRDILQLDLLGNFELRQSICIRDIRVLCQECFGKAPQDWKKRVHGSKLDISRIGFHEGAFVIWGEAHGEGSYQPYIFLAGLVSPTQIEALRAKEGVVQRILEMLRLFVRDCEKFDNSEDEFDELKNELEDILTDLK